MADETTEVKQAAETLVKAPVVYAEEAAAKLKAEVEKWFNDLRQNLSSLDTEMHNKLHAAKEDLKTRLAAIL